MSAAATSAPQDLPHFSLRRHSAALTVSLLERMQERDDVLAAGDHHAQGKIDQRRGKSISGFLRRFSRKKDNKSAMANVLSTEEDIMPRRTSVHSHAWTAPTPVITTSHQHSPALPRRRVISQPAKKIWSMNDASWEEAVLGYPPHVQQPRSMPKKDVGDELEFDFNIDHVSDHDITASFLYAGARDFEGLRTTLEAQEGGWMRSRQSVAFSTQSSISEESIKVWPTAASRNNLHSRASFDAWYPGPAIIRYGDCQRAVQAGEALRQGEGFVAEKLYVGLEALKREQREADLANNGYGGAAMYRYGQFKREAEAAAAAKAQSLASSTPVADRRFSAFSLTTPTRRVSNPLDAVVAPPRQRPNPNQLGYEAQDNGRAGYDEKDDLRSLATLRRGDPIAMWPKYWDHVSGSPSTSALSALRDGSAGRFAPDFADHGIVEGADVTVTCRHASGSSVIKDRGMPEADHLDASLYGSRECSSKEPAKPLVRVASEPRSLFLNRQLSASGATSPSHHSPTRARSVDSGIANFGEMTGPAREQPKVRDGGDFRQYAAAARDGVAGGRAEHVVVGDLKKKAMTPRRSLVNLNGQQVAIGRPRVLSGLLRCQPRLPVPRKDASEVKVIALEPTVRLRMVGSR